MTRPTYHLVDGWYTACGKLFNVWRMWATGDPAKVTCKRCAEILRKQGGAG